MAYRCGERYPASAINNNNNIIIGIFPSQKKETYKVKTILVDSTMELDWIRMVDQLPSTDPARVRDLRKVRHIVNKANNFKNKMNTLRKFRSL